ncbi:MAG: uL15m family ribosomal protein [bacterium]|nr:uL15m family ribosomal protein [bacterium]
MQLHTLQSNNKRKSPRRVGRGGKRGKTSGRGHKGQKQHGGHGIRPEMRDTIKRLPKRRGFGKNRARTVNSARIIYTPVNLSTLDSVFSKGDTVTPQALVAKGVVNKRGGKLPAVKVLGKGDLKKALTIENCAISESARTAVEKAGGLVK